MRWITTVLATFALTWIFSPLHALAQEKPLAIEVYFSPHGGATEAIVRELNKAKSTVLVQVFSFTSAPTV